MKSVKDSLFLNIFIAESFKVQVLLSQINTIIDWFVVCKKADLNKSVC